MPHLAVWFWKMHWSNAGIKAQKTDIYRHTYRKSVVRWKVLLIMESIPHIYIFNIESSVG